MEEVALAVARFLSALDLPVTIVGAMLGLFTAIKRPGFDSTDFVSASLPERVGVGLCAGVAFLGLLGLSLTMLKYGTVPTSLALVFAIAILLCAVPALLWKSRWRGSAEGIATICVSLAAFLSGFTIGYMFVPLVALMVWVCLERLGLFRRHSDAMLGSP